MSTVSLIDGHDDDMPSPAQRIERIFARMGGKFTKPIGYLPGGIPVYIQSARGSSKSTLELKKFLKALGVEDA